MSNVTYMMSGMFQNAISFNQPLNNWNVSQVRYMNKMFLGATSFNQPLNNWNVLSKLVDWLSTLLDMYRMMEGVAHAL